MKIRSILAISLLSRFVLIALISCLAFTLPSVAAAPSSCPLQRSTYTAIGNSNYTFVFSKPLATAAEPRFATATLRHTKRGTIDTFNVGQGQGYGSSYLDSLIKQSTENNPNSFMLLFFNSGLRSVKSPQVYLHVAGLGSADWYSKREGSRNYPLGDVMWRLSSCRR
ncbi:hypothetical protein H6F89_25700 [Cyanobacteria bacterium FACHB-63]|nr:hypothetical protein [Cyanobacteria bacterium FACHB-63]